MTKIIGLTGGMGSGKTTVAKMFIDLGVPVYFADEAGRECLQQPHIIKKLESYFGQEIITDGKIDRAKLSSVVFADVEKLQLLNSVVHPYVREDYEKWLKNNLDHDILIKESAILFESKTSDDCDAVITVSAPVTDRIARIKVRDKISTKSIESRLANQLSDHEREERSDFIIYNDELEKTRVQVENIFKILSKE